MDDDARIAKVAGSHVNRHYGALLTLYDWNSSQEGQILKHVHGNWHSHRYWLVISVISFISRFLGTSNYLSQTELRHPMGIEHEIQFYRRHPKLLVHAQNSNPNKHKLLEMSDMLTCAGRSASSPEP